VFRDGSIRCLKVRVAFGRRICASNLPATGRPVSRIFADARWPYLRYRQAVFINDYLHRRISIVGSTCLPMHPVRSCLENHLGVIRRCYDHQHAFMRELFLRLNAEEEHFL
jgi:hypothetical protein